MGIINKRIEKIRIYFITHKKELFNVLVLFLLFLCSTMIRFWLANFDKALHIYGDEIRYYDIARSLAYDGGMSVRGAELEYQKIGYSLLILPAFIIQNGINRQVLISIINCVVMSLSIFPAWFIGKEVGLPEKYRYLTVMFVLVCPDMLFTLTYMSEVLYWPLSLFLVYFWIKARTNYKWQYSIAFGAACYFVYLCKEIALAFLVADFGFLIIFPLMEYWFYGEKIHYEKKAILNFLISTFTFFVFYIMIKFLLFLEYGNSYNQTAIDAIASFNNFIYMLYGYVYTLLCAVLSFGVLPFILPFIIYKKLNDKLRRTYFLFLLTVLSIVATIAYTITVREDLGRVVPRVHMRYLGPFFVMAIITLWGACEVAEKKELFHTQNLLKTLLGIGMFGILLVAFVKGIYPGAAVDQFFLLYYQQIQKFLEAHIGVIAFWGSFGSSTVLNVFIIFFFILVTILLFKSRKKSKIGIFVISLFVLSCFNSFLGYKQLRNFYICDSNSIKDAINLNQWFSNLGSPYSVVFVAQDDIGKESYRAFDTYFDGRQAYVVAIDDLLYNDGQVIDLRQDQVKESLFKVPLNIRQLDYIITDNATSQYIDTIYAKKIEEASNASYSVYRNIIPNEIHLKKNFTVYFYGEKYNARDFEIKGISGNEEGFSWTDGDNFSIYFPKVTKESNIHVDIDIIGTNGNQRYGIIYDGEYIKEGAVNGESKISFDIMAKDSEFSIEIDLPDAVSPSSQGISGDTRELALQLQKIDIIVE